MLWGRPSPKKNGAAATVQQMGPGSGVRGGPLKLWGRAFSPELLATAHTTADFIAAPFRVFIHVLTSKTPGETVEAGEAGVAGEAVEAGSLHRPKHRAWNCRSFARVE